MAKAKRILIPTDFSIHSLQFLITVLEEEPAAQVEVVLAYGMRSGSFMTELFIFSKEEYLQKVQSEEFIKGCQMIENRFGEKVSGLYADVLTSDNPNYIRNYLKGNHIHEVILHEEHYSTCTHKHYLDLHRPLMKAAPFLSVLSDSSFSEKQHAEQNEIADLFFRSQYDVTY
ncbi:hypothetical protein ACFU8T_20605 [Sphingobacterium spiritivorum]|uniref:hypothetical protein n=1 Tax=Sphingobacterium spiritivorum TaxID=258 RepID=UPI0036A41041